MEKQKHFRAVLGIALGLIVAALIWFRGEWSAIELGCLTIMILVGMALLINNQRSQVFHDAAGVLMSAAVIAYIWASTRHAREALVNLVLSCFFVWLAIKPYYVKWQGSRDRTTAPVVATAPPEVRSDK